MGQELVEFSFQPKTLEEAMKFAELVSKSDLVPKDYKGNPGNVLIAIQWGNEIGLKPLQALQNIAVINGRPCLWGDAALALVRGSGLVEDFREDLHEPSMTATCTIKRKDQPTPIIRTFSKADAEKASLWGKNNWSGYPKRMLQMRARAFALRDGFTDVLKGISVAEEQQDVIDVTGTPLPAPPEPPKRLSQTNGAGTAADADPVVEYVASLSNAQSLDGLKAVWTQLTMKNGLYETLDMGQQARLLSAKNIRKQQLDTANADAPSA